MRASDGQHRIPISAGCMQMKHRRRGYSHAMVAVRRIKDGHLIHFTEKRAFSAVKNKRNCTWCNGINSGIRFMRQLEMTCTHRSIWISDSHAAPVLLPQRYLHSAHSTPIECLTHSALDGDDVVPHCMALLLRILMSRRQMIPEHFSWGKTLPGLFHLIQSCTYSRLHSCVAS